MVPVWRELLADLETPVAAFASSSATGPASCSSRSSTASAGAASRSSVATRRRRSCSATGTSAPTASCPTASRPTAACWPPSRRCCTSTARRAARPAAAARRRRRLPRLRRRARGRAPADVPPDDLGLPDAVLSVIGEPGGVRPLAPAGLRSSRTCRSWVSTTPPRRRLRRRRRPPRPARRRLGRPLPYTPVRAARPRRAAARGPSTMRAASTSAPSRWPRSTSSPATSSRSCWRSASTSSSTPTRSTCTGCCARSTRARTCTSSAIPRSRSSARRPSRWCRCSTAEVISRPIAGTRRRGRTDEDDRRLGRRAAEHPKEIAEHVMLVDLARNDVGRVAQFGTVHVDELMTLERYSHVMHLTSQVSGELRPGQGPDRRAAGHAAGRHGVRRAEGAGHGDHRRARADQARAVRRRRRLRRLLGQPRHRHRHPHHGHRPDGRRRCRPAPASWPTAIPRSRTSSAATRPRRCWPRCPRPGA